MTKALDKKVLIFIICLIAGFLMAFLPRIGVQTTTNNIFELSSFEVSANQNNP